MDLNASLKDQIDHIFLPPRHGLGEDDHPEAGLFAKDLLENLVQSLGAFDRLCPDPGIRSCQSLVNDILATRHNGGILEGPQLTTAITRMCKDGYNILAIHLRAQNAGVYITNIQGQPLRVETFELLAPNSVVMRCEGALLRSFPSNAIDIPTQVFADETFVAALVEGLVHLDQQVDPENRPQTRKAGDENSEVRDTVNPTLVTDMLIAWLRGLGGEHSEFVTVQKRSREQVNYNGRRLAWHRSALWLFVRVALRLTLDRREHAAGVSITTYKAFMAFHMARVLRKACAAGLSSDLLYAMSAKVARRAYKTKQEHSCPWLDFVTQVVQESNKLLHRRWQEIQAPQGIAASMAKLQGANNSQDTLLNLKHLTNYLEAIEPQANGRRPGTLQGPELVIPKHGPENLPCGVESGGEFDLYEFEAWVTCSLPGWEKGVNMSPTSVIEKIGHLITTYHDVAKSSYERNPDAMSFAYLCILELWVFCDKLATRFVPLLTEYHPALQHAFLDKLVLPRHEQMKRLTCVEQHIMMRTHKASSSSSPLSDNFGAPTSFAVRYAATSPRLLFELDRVKSLEITGREEKLAELAVKKRNYDNQIRLYAAASHDTYTRTDSNGRVREDCTGVCGKCRALNIANKMEIDVWEDILPPETHKAQAVVAEVYMDSVVEAWRTVTLQLVHCIFSETSAAEPPCSDQAYWLFRWQKVKPSFDSNARLEPCSITKPYLAARYRSIKVSEATESKVCKHHAAVYAYWDRKVSRPMASFHDRQQSIPQACSFAHLTHDNTLKNYVRFTSHTSNQILASQHMCPTNMSLIEFRAFGHMRSGVHLQWQNVLGQLFSPALNLQSIETCFLLAQTTSEAGPMDGNSDVLRIAHHLFNDDHFALRVMEGLELGLVRCRESWDCASNIFSLLRVCLRVLELSQSDTVKFKSLQVLGDLRKLTLRWALHLFDKMDQLGSAEGARDLGETAVFFALLCFNSFDVRDNYLRPMLQCPRSIAILTKASVLCHEYRVYTQSSCNPLVRILSQNRNRLSYAMENQLAETVTSGNSKGLDDMMLQFWPAFVSDGRGWKLHSMETDKPRIVVTHCLAEDQDPLPVSLNLLTGSLLIDGYPLATLPDAYLNHDTFKLLFGPGYSPRVAPSNILGFQFSVSQTHHGWDIHFSMRNGGHHLVIRAVNNGQSCEFIHPRNLGSEFPTSFLHDFHHWLVLSSDVVEFRPPDSCWNASSPDLWTLDLKTRVLRRGREKMVRLHSQTANIVAGIMKPLESEDRINCIHSDNGLRVELPRLRLTFLHRHDGASPRMESQDYTGMVIDEDQSFGSLIGLENRLILTSLASVFERAILIPRGEPVYQRNGHHVSVKIATPSVKPVTSEFRPLVRGSITYCNLLIDEMLGRLCDSSFLQDKLFLAHLHALTSYCLPDPLTGRTGTEEALDILTSAAVRSFLELSDDNVSTLQSIACISPRREYYPSHLQCMETVKWSSNLPILSQDDALNHAVLEIYKHARGYRVFTGSDPGSRVEPRAEKVLLRRALNSNAIFQVSDFGAERSTKTQDMAYQGRRHDSVSSASRQRSQRAERITRIIFRNEAAVAEAVSSNIFSVLMSVLDDTVLGPSSPAPQGLKDIDIQRMPQELVRQSWYHLHNLLANETNLEREKYRLGLFFSVLAFNVSNEDGQGVWQAVQTLSAFVTVPEMRNVRPEFLDEFPVRLGWEIDGELQRQIENHAYRFDDCPEARLVKYRFESQDQFRQRSAREWEYNRRKVISDARSTLMRQWPCRRPRIPSGNQYRTYFDVAAAGKDIMAVFEIAWRNFKFKEDLTEIQNVMTKLAVTSLTDQATPQSSPIRGIQDPSEAFADSRGLFSRRAPDLRPFSTLPTSCISTGLPLSEKRQTCADYENMGQLLRQLDHLAKSPHEIGYVSELKQSAEASKSNTWTQSTQVNTQRSLLSVEEGLRLAGETVRAVDETIRAALEPTKTHAVAARSGCHWPRVSTMFLFRQLSRKRWCTLPMDWKRCIVAYALATCELQRLRRVAAARSPADAKKHAENSGHTNWDPMEYPEWLLLEVESGILIRPVQLNIALHMLNPPDASTGSVMQLNMGEGKSSVISPCVAAAVADGEKLARVIVAKPQSKQATHMLVSKLGGLLDRRVYFLPFSRSLTPSPSDVEQIHQVMSECLREGGVMLVQPEHLMSFRLMVIESVGAGRTSSAQSLLRTQKWLEDVARDIVDESDENFSVKFELIYTIGSQQPVDLGRERWEHIQTILGCVADICEEMYNLGTFMVQCDRRYPDSVPIMRLLDSSARAGLTERLVARICTEGLERLPIHRQNLAMRDRLRMYLTQADVDKETVSIVEDDSNGFFCDSVKRGLWLVRGLLAGNVLVFALSQKRWRVDYGRDQARNPPTMLAVPFRAKDSPAPRSEFSHPDVVIILTCLTYYYQGLTDSELDQAFVRLGQSSSQAEYDLWVRDAKSLDQSYRALAGVNLRDREKCINDIYPSLRYSKAAIDYYLSNFVFSQHMREFPKKLSASGWDMAKPKTWPLTGFSGTCDSKYVLPLPIQHLDLSEQRGTNALVLRYMLQSETRVKELAETETRDSAGGVNSIIRAVVESKIQVIIDVGAQILELNNQQAAGQWLAETEHEAVIFFDDHDEISVLTRGNHVQAFAASPYRLQPDKCLVFLDEAHSRGTDLVLPASYRAAVTLGPRLTKDRLVQACMRMRKLGAGQSVTFMVPPELQQRIREVISPEAHRPISSVDIIAWTIYETWADLRKCVPLWATQGLRHVRQDGFRSTGVALGTSDNLCPDDIAVYVEDEAQTLQQRYSPGRAPCLDDLIGFPVGQDASGYIDRIRMKCTEHQVVSFDASHLHEEQERELSPELEHEAEIEKPPPRQPLHHTLHQDVESFVSTGVVSPGSKGFLLAFDAFQDSTAAPLSPAKTFPCDIYVTKDFAKTVDAFEHDVSDLFMRPVQWIAIGSGDPCTVVILSPWEANILYDAFKKTRNARLHQYHARTNLVHPSLDHLTLYSTPREPHNWTFPVFLMTQLNLFAGQPWLNSYSHYVDVSRFLGLSHVPGIGQGARRVAADGFEGKTPANPACVFVKSPVAFLKQVFEIRGDGQGARGDVGYIFGGMVLLEVHFATRVT